MPDSELETYVRRLLLEVYPPPKAVDQKFVTDAAKAVPTVTEMPLVAQQLVKTWEMIVVNNRENGHPARLGDQRAGINLRRTR